MAGIFKKAMGLFVEFEEEPQTQNTQKNPSNPVTIPQIRTASPQQVLNTEDLDKFEKHFDKMFEQANFPGPDYYEFWKMMDTLEAHIKDEHARISATFAALSIQGMTKEKLIETANLYKEMIAQDKARFQKVANDKSESEIGQKRKDLKGFEEAIQRNSEMIQKLTKEITAAQTSIGSLKATITEEENKLAKNMQGYMVACEAMAKKINDDITKIQTTL